MSGPVGLDDPDAFFLMLYCDSSLCLVNTFEHGPWGICPGCGTHGEVL